MWVSMIALRAARLADRARRVGESGCVESRVVEEVFEPQPDGLAGAAMLIAPSEVVNTPVGIDVGWSLPACPGIFAVDQPARRLEVEEEHLGLQQRGPDPLAPAGSAPFQQGQQDPLGGEEPGGQVGHRDASPHRAPPGLAGDRHQATHALGDLVEAGTVTIGPVLAEAGDGCVHEPGLRRASVS